MDNKIVKLAAGAFIGLVVVPIVWNATITGVVYAYAGIKNMLARKEFDKKIEQGLKDGSIIKIDGDYYSIETKEEA